MNTTNSALLVQALRRLEEDLSTVEQFDHLLDQYLLSEDKVSQHVAVVFCMSRRLVLSQSTSQYQSYELLDIITSAIADSMDRCELERLYDEVLATTPKVKPGTESLSDSGRPEDYSTLDEYKQYLDRYHNDERLGARSDEYYFDYLVDLTSSLNAICAAKDSIFHLGQIVIQRQPHQVDLCLHLPREFTEILSSNSKLVELANEEVIVHHRYTFEGDDCDLILPTSGTSTQQWTEYLSSRAQLLASWQEFWTSAQNLALKFRKANIEDCS